MKKTYIIPTLKVVKIQTTTILAGSPGLTGTYTGGAVLSRQDADSEWDEEEQTNFDRPAGAESREDEDLWDE